MGLCEIFVNENPPVKCTQLCYVRDWKENTCTSNQWNESSTNQTLIKTDARKIDTRKMKKKMISSKNLRHFVLKYATFDISFGGINRKWKPNANTYFCMNREDHDTRDTSHAFSLNNTHICASPTFSTPKSFLLCIYLECSRGKPEMIYRAIEETHDTKKFTSDQSRTARSLNLLFFQIRVRSDAFPNLQTIAWDRSIVLHTNVYFVHYFYQACRD